MPHRLEVYQQHRDPPRQPAQARTATAVPAPQRQAGDFTLAHAGHQVRLRPVAFWVVVGTLVIMAAWTLTTATYFAFHDDVLTRLMARQADMQYGYEDRIAELRAQVDRISSRQLLDQEKYEQKLDQLLRRQSTLESRASALGTLPDPTATGSIKPPARGITGDPARGAAAKPAPISGPRAFAPPFERDTRFNAAGPAPALASLSNGDGVDGVIERLQTSLDRVESEQSAQLNSLEETYDTKMRRIRGVLADIGVDTNKIVPPARGVGGPFVPVRQAADAGGFDRQIYRISLAHAQVERLTRMLAAVPVRKPVDGEPDLSSGFGVRIDPFLNRPAMHTGLDFRADVGEPIHATATGTVTAAGWTGGYGKMVEIDHGNGFSTRYGHMSQIDVSVGQTVRIGQLLGKTGSTGRSTGPHLHYETRIGGEAVDPQRFLRAGAKLEDAM